ncbi:hypothetical protein [Roseobacter sinensis]|uniref:Uncharacterized protein n=1 Tax=Roseobacter sinensis TaxID=2931391 RepID=A0ABT3BJL9_9RHOB|nr:hypothetical protein [Roseobacter sp. WL0113]MCV3273398.1 hypothetical protein [Roseobacter sp. WL0113]
MVDFFQSLGLTAYLILAVLVLVLWNIKKLILLRSPLDSQQHRTWRATGGTTRPDHLENSDLDAPGQSKTSDSDKDK